MWLWKKKDKIKLDYATFTKLDIYFANHCGTEVEIIKRSGITWMKWGNYYIAKTNGINLIRRGSLRESDTIYTYDIFEGVGKWTEQPSDFLINKIEEAIDYWDLHIG